MRQLSTVILKNQWYYIIRSKSIPLQDSRVRKKRKAERQRQSRTASVVHPRRLRAIIWLSTRQVGDSSWSRSDIGRSSNLAAVPAQEPLRFCLSFSHRSGSLPFQRASATKSISLFIFRLFLLAAFPPRACRSSSRLSPIPVFSLSVP